MNRRMNRKKASKQKIDQLHCYVLIEKMRIDWDKMDLGTGLKAEFSELKDKYFDRVFPIRTSEDYYLHIKAKELAENLYFK